MFKFVFVFNKKWIYPFDLSILYCCGKCIRIHRFSNLLRFDDHLYSHDDNVNCEAQCWKKLRQLAVIYGTKPQVQPPPMTNTRKQRRNGSQPPNEILPFLGSTTTTKTDGKNSLTESMLTNRSNNTLLISSFRWLIIDQIYDAALLGGLKIDGCMSKVQGSVSLSQ